jgi:ribosome-binding protein aMBF1 (putative translation factor)
MKLASKHDMTPEFVVASSYTKAEKLKLLEEMRRNALGRQREKEDESGPSLGTIDLAIRKVRAEADDAHGAALGRTTSG